MLIKQLPHEERVAHERRLNRERSRRYRFSKNVNRLALALKYERMAKQFMSDKYAEHQEAVR